MNYFLIVFKSRAQTVRFSLYLKRSGIFYETVNTPKSIQSACGLSIKVKKDYFSIVQKLLKVNGFSGFDGFYYPVLLPVGVLYKKVL